MFSGNDITYQDITVKNDGFWPDLNVGEFQKLRRMPLDMPCELLEEALLSVIIEVNTDLQSFKQQHFSNTVKSLKDINKQESEIKSITANYKKAVYARAKTSLIGEIVSVSNQKQTIDANQDEMEKQLIAEATRAIRSILGFGRCTVKLI